MFTASQSRPQVRPGARASLAVLGLSLFASLMGGCVGQGEYDRLYETNNSLTARNAELTRERDEARAAADLMRGSIGSGAGTMADLQKQNLELRRLLDQAMADYRSLEGRMAGLQFGPLDAATDEALTTLAAQYPDLIKYDSARGMLRFASDLTFDSGQDAVKNDAKAALNALAQVLSSGSAAKYQVVVEGHTDSQRISSGTASRHPTNRHLSAHRSIAVINELGKMGVPSDRMMAAGWGEHKPAVPNTGNGNTPANRRVEIFLARSHSGTDTSSTTTPTSLTTPTSTEPEMDITK